MPGPLEQWLETFMCGQFAENFERYGYRTLQAVCQMQLPQLLSIGIPHKESDIILQNIQILRQSTAAVAQQQQMQHGMSSSYGSSMTHDPHGTAFQGRDALQEHSNYMSPDSSCFNYGNQSSSVSGQFYNQSNAMSQPMDSMMSSTYQQQYQGSSFPQQQFTDGSQYPSIGMPSPSSSAAVVTSRHGYAGHVPGSPLMGQSSMRHSHPHLRSSGQTPQEVANNILHMAASSYPSNNTIQVPLSKTRSAPYHVPSRSPNYSTKLQDTQQHMCSDYGQGQFAYPSPPHQPQLLMQSRDPRLSPISPVSAGMMASPHSHQIGRAVPSSSPCSMNSPSKALIRSPGPSTQLMSSPQRGQYQTSSMNTSHQRMVSPVPANQQLKVSVPSSMPQPFQQCYYGNMLTSSQYQQFQQPMSARYSPSSISQISDSGQFPNSPSSQGRHFTHSPGGRSGHFSNISSPYTPGSGNYLSPNQAHGSPSVTQNVSDGNLAGSPSMKQCSSPLQSLQKLCMLPDTQVVDPKTVVKEACVPSSGDLGAKNTEPCSSSSNSVCTNTLLDSNCSPTFSELISSTENETTKIVSNLESVVSPEMKYQPKKMMLLRAAKEDLCSPQSEDTIQYGSSKSEAEDSKDHKIESDETEQVVQEHESQTKEEKSVEIVHTDIVVSSKSCENKSDTSETVKKKNKEVSDNQTPDTCESSCTQACVDTNVKDETSDNLKPDVETSLQNTENTQDSSQSTEKCDVDSKTGAGMSENVQLTTADIQEVKVQSKDVEMAYESESSLSEHESQMVVRKDLNKTYSKQERLKSFEISPRIRGDSTGSLSDERANSDFEYEDHIGCDDIETGFSDIENKSNEIVEESVDDTKDLNSDITNGNVVIDRVMITGSHWKKNGKQNMSVSSAKKRKRNGHMKSLPFITKVSEIDSDDVPSPLGGDVVDGLEGPVGVDNGDGTVSVTRPSHIRQRKTPVKYKDTSFFQGDFVFVEEEEEEYLQRVEPRRKSAKKSIDVNHNPKNGVVKSKNAACGSSDVGGKSKPKIQVSSEASVSGNIKNTLKLLAKQTEKLKDEKPKSTCNVNNIKFLKRGSDGDLEVVKTVSVVETIKKDEHVRSNVPKSGLSFDRAHKSKSDPKHTPSQNAAAVITRSSKQEGNIEKNGSVKKKVSRRQINGVKTDSVSCEKEVVNDRTRRSNTLVNQNREKIIKTSKSKKVTEKTKPNDELEVIEIDSDSEGAENVTGAKNKVNDTSEDGEIIQPNTSSVSVECQNLVSDEESGGRNFMFSLVEDEMIDETLIGEDLGDRMETSIKTEVNEPTASVVKLPSKRSSSGSNLKSKNSCATHDKSKQSGKGLKRKTYVDDDPDFDLGPIKKSFKSLKFDKTGDVSSSRKGKKKPDNWANFKGPKIIFVGKKGTPKHCVVINDPFEETASKKTKVTAQNVTRIEISQLPSDKSVLIPYNETLESENWTCALCGKHSSYKFLGDLFGPYTVETMSDDMLDLSPTVRLSTKKRKSEEGHASGSKGNKSGKRGGSMSREVNDWKEVWVHEACSVYSDGVFLIGSKIYGLQEAVRIASQTPCSLCSEMGAMIGCLNKGCQQKFHHVCAQEADCYLDEENFSLLCPKHKVKKLKQLEASTSTSVG